MNIFLEMPHLIELPEGINQPPCSPEEGSKENSLACKDMCFPHEAISGISFTLTMKEVRVRLLC